MSDQVTDYQGESAEAGQPLEQAPDNQPTYVTPDELNARLNDVLEQAKRFAQSKTDQTSARIQKVLKEQEAKLQDRVNALKAAGFTVADDVVEQQRRRIVESVLTGDDENEGEDEQPAQAAGPVDYKMQARALASQARIANAIAESGIEIKPGDPELRSIQRSAPTPEEWERSYLDAIKRKAQRIGKPVNLEEPEAGEPPAARIPGGAGGAGGSPATLEANAKRLEQLLADPVKNQKEINQLVAANEKLLKQRR